MFLDRGTEGNRYGRAEGDGERRGRAEERQGEIYQQSKKKLSTISATLEKSRQNLEDKLSRLKTELQVKREGEEEMTETGCGIRAGRFTRQKLETIPGIVG